MSTQNIVIVESPSKAKTIQKYLGADYAVFASYGHIRDLPSKNGSVDPQHDFAMTWAMEESSEKRVGDIAKALKGAKRLILATDPDREGEAISWHILEVLMEAGHLSGIEVQRVTFNEITKHAIKTAMASPRSIDEPLVQAYLARRALDYLVGFNLSPVLWRKLPGARSAGRVQSVALRMVVEREQEIETFIPQEYWSVLVGLLSQKKEAFDAKVVAYNGQKLQKLSIASADEAFAIQDSINQASFVIDSVESKPVRRHPPAPFITSTLQQEASRKLGFSATKTMMLAQRLYEGVEIKGEVTGLITYMRTDGVSLAGEAVANIRDEISSLFGKDYVPDAPRVYKSKAKNAQEAHEAIRPTHIRLAPSQVTFLEKDMLNLYGLIWNRTMACQMESASFDRTTIEMSGTDKQGKAVVLRSTGSVLVFDGFLKLYQEGKDDEEDEENRKLPRLTAGDAVAVNKVVPEQHHTEPAPRFSEASLVKRMEELGIGRPSTYASTIGVLKDRHYVRMDKNRLIPEDQGRIVTHFLHHYFKTYVGYDFTASLEEKLDLISDGKLGWLELLGQFWTEFESAIKEIAPLRISEVIDLLNEDMGQHLFPPVLDEEGHPTEKDPRDCPTCGEGYLSLKLGRFGAFVGCSRYPECRHTRPLTVTGEQATTPLDADGKELGVDTTTGLPVMLKSGRFGPYIEVGTGKTAKRCSIPKAFNPSDLTLEQGLQLLSLPRVLGNHPETGQPLTVALGRFGPYIQMDNPSGEKPKYYKLDSADTALSMTYEKALSIIAEKGIQASSGEKKGTTTKAKKATDDTPKKAKKTPSKTAKAKSDKPKVEKEDPSARVLGENENGQSIKVKAGRFGAYVTDGKINASLPKSLTAEEITLQEGLDLLTKKAQKMLEKGDDVPAKKPAKGAKK